MAINDDDLPTLTPEQQAFADKMAAELNERCEKYGRDLLASDVKREVLAYLQEVANTAVPELELIHNPDGSVSWLIPADVLPLGFDPGRAGD